MPNPSENTVARPHAITPWLNLHEYTITEEASQKILSLLEYNLPGEAKLAVIEELNNDIKGGILNFPELTQELKNRLAREIIEDIKVKWNTVLEPEYVRNPVNDVANYLKRLHEQYKKVLKQLCQQTGRMNMECESSICIPVASHDESRFIYRTLEAFTYQTSSAKSYEIVLLLNTPEEKRANQSVAETESEVERFTRDYKGFPLKVANCTLNSSNLKNIGFIRGLVTDLALYRHFSRCTTNDHILIRTDADITAVHPEYVDNYHKLFKQHPTVDAFKGSHRWSPDNYARDPLLLINQVFYDLLSSMRRIYDNLPEFGEPNFAVRASTYAAVGGYPCNVTLGEDLMFGERLVMDANDARRPNVIRYAGLKSKLYSSTRRAEAALEHDIPCVAQWNSNLTKFRITDPARSAQVDVRKLSDAELVIAAEKLINKTLDYSIRYYEELRTRSPIIAKIMGFLGFEYNVVSPTRIEITNADKFLKRWKDIARSLDAEW